MIMHEHMLSLCFRWVFVSGFFFFFFFSSLPCTFSYLGSEPRFKVNKKHPSFHSILHPRCHFTSLASEVRVPFSPAEKYRGSLNTHPGHICRKPRPHPAPRATEEWIQTWRIGHVVFHNVKIFILTPKRGDRGRVHVSLKTGIINKRLLNAARLTIDFSLAPNC